MNYFYSSQQRTKILNSLTGDQQNYLIDKLKRGKRTVFSNELARGKGSYTGSDRELEKEIQEWEFIDLLDGGEGNRPYHCECGMSLRYQYIVRNIQTGEMKKLGRNHFEFHTGIPANIVRDIIKGFEQIDYELDEILYKVENGWDSSEITKANTLKIDIPTDIQQQIKLNLPLMDKQINKLEKIVREKEYNDWLKERSEVINRKQRAARIRWEESSKTVTPAVDVPTKVEPKRLSFKPVLTSPLGEDAHLFIVELLENNGTISVLDVCYKLNEDIPHNFKGTYSTGKPKVYFYVSMVLEQLKEQGACRVESSSLEDRWYSII